MNFDSAFYLFCFLPVLMLLFAVVRGTKGRNVLLLVCGLVFYSFGSLNGLVLLLASALAGAAVSFSGLLGFVGLIVPHAARFLVGWESRWLLSVSILLGAAFLSLCDMLARVLFAPFELPVGIVMAFLGAPFFIWLLLNRKGGHNNDHP